MTIGEASNRQSVEWGRGNPDRRCVATSRAGTQCRNWAIRGGAVCRYHGGSTERVKKKARERIEQAQDLVAMRMIGFAIDEGVPPQVALAAAKDILDRGGTTTPTAVEVTVQPWEELLGDVAHLTKAQHDAIYHPERAAQTPALAAHDDVVDAEVVPEAPETQPDAPGDAADGAGQPANPDPPFAQPSGTPSRALVPLEDATAEVAQANRAARVARARRMR
jgi:hypothetical protein